MCYRHGSRNRLTTFVKRAKSCFIHLAPLSICSGSWSSSCGSMHLTSITRFGSGSLGRKSLEGEPSHDALPSLCDILVAAYVFR